ncbi:hypothetical protein Pmani_011757 [Petrolisthes manimaculis]|uniref:Uncharacterized protein n=1 Tax=Petrolisthes manimaculis TaxID=1843537 RepID=A0AAE1PZD8_9EUCA|nr:hypothetical protein Pmani_011757 [Petrolisthes manimaculis]
MPFRLPPLSGVLYGASVVWDGVKAAVPESCLGGPDERLNFAKHGKNRGDVEMTSVKGEGEGGEGGGEGGSMDGQPPPLEREGSIGSTSTTVGVEGGEHDMITEWQAGWNVTNAIQV